MDMKIGNTFKLTKKLGSGAFGQIFSGVNVVTNAEVAIKLEQINSPVPQLMFEGDIYKKLLADSNFVDIGIPNIYYLATED